MLLIATDEAGYGPRLGPLVVSATAWKFPNVSSQPALIDGKFAPLRLPVSIGSLVIRVDDSKAIYKSGQGLACLHAVVSASQNWCGRDQRLLGELLPVIAAEDIASIVSTPWLNRISALPFLDESETNEVVAAWRSSGIELVDVQARIITAANFNLACDQRRNKADLLSESTIGLIQRLIQWHGTDESRVVVHCDRHGGRRYYGSVLQHVFSDASVSVLSESKVRSVYRLLLGQKCIDIEFTVKGDSFTPVALASMHAKYLRERMMESFNDYFASLHPRDQVLRPTAGYPGDADRFLADIESTIQKHRIRREHLIRSR